MAKSATGIDIGLRSACMLRGSYKGNTFHVTDFHYQEVSADDPAAAWRGVEIPFKTGPVRIGLTGRDVNIRYTRVPRVPEWQLRKLMHFEVAEVGDQSGAEVASDYNLLPELPEIEGEDVVLLGMVREALLEKHMEGLAEAGGKLEAFTTSSLALYNAYLRYGVVEDDTVLICNLGHENLDVIIVRGPDLVFARNLTGGSKLFDAAIAERFQCSPQKAEEIKKKLVTLEPGASYSDSNAEKASRAAQGAAGQILSLLQSTVLFCKSQIKLTGLKVDRVLLCGGGARMPGLLRYIQNGMSVPVELFNPFQVVDTSKLNAEDADELERRKLESVVALGLATMGSDPDAYSIEILPESIRKRREFWSGPALLIGTAALALGFLVFHGVHLRGKLGAAKTESAKLTRDLNKADRTHKSAEALRKENERLAILAEDLQATGGGGEQLARVLDLLDRKLPNDFWLDDLACEVRHESSIGIDRDEPRPVLHLEGKARPGVENLAVLYEQFVAGLREGLPGASISEQLSSDGTSFSVDLSLFSPAADEPESSENQEEDV